MVTVSLVLRRFIPFLLHLLRRGWIGNVQRLIAMALTQVGKGGSNVNWENSG